VQSARQLTKSTVAQPRREAQKFRTVILYRADVAVDQRWGIFRRLCAAVNALDELGINL